MTTFTLTEAIRPISGKGSFNEPSGILKLVPPDDDESNISYLYVGNDEHCVLYLLQDVIADKKYVHPISIEDACRLSPDTYHYKDGKIYNDNVTIRLRRPRLRVPFSPEFTGEPAFTTGRFAEILRYTHIPNLQTMRAQVLDGVFVVRDTAILTDGRIGIFCKMRESVQKPFVIPLTMTGLIPPLGDVFLEQGENESMMTIKTYEKIIGMRLMSTSNAEAVRSLYDVASKHETTKSVNPDAYTTLSVFAPDIVPILRLTQETLNNDDVSIKNEIFEDLPPDTEKFLNGMALQKILKVLRGKDVTYTLDRKNALIMRSGNITIVQMLMHGLIPPEPAK